MNSKNKLIVALDVNNETKALGLVEKLKGGVKFFKVGLELFSSCGPGIIGEIKKQGYEVFLDLKLHDIPNTVAKTAASLTHLGAAIINVHALGGYEMMRRANEEIAKKAKELKITKPKLIAVTILTSMDENELNKTGIDDNIQAQVLRLASLAKEAGLDGVVASPKEVTLIRSKLGPDFIIITPGVRPAASAVGDQKRVATPKEAIEAGANYIVVGRPITEAPDPAKAARNILKEIQ